uniref:Uncharacterized protein n=1 Tax=Fagus sylvatica TaxID=28930 RepID=A0A2N9FLV9_FAGSY
MAFSNSKAFKMFAMAIVLAVMSSEMVGAIIHDGTPSFKLGRRALGVSKPNDYGYGGDPLVVEATDPMVVEAIPHNCQRGSEDGDIYADSYYFKTCLDVLYA